MNRLSTSINPLPSPSRVQGDLGVRVGASDPALLEAVSVCLWCFVVDVAFLIVVMAHSPFPSIELFGNYALCKDGSHRGIMFFKKTRKTTLQVVSSGMLGRKSGKGMFIYPPGKVHIFRITIVFCLFCLSAFNPSEKKERKKKIKEETLFKNTSF